MKMKLHSRDCLLVLSRLPYPPIGGDKLKSYNLIRLLSSNYNLIVIVITDESENHDAQRFLDDNAFEHKIFYIAKTRFVLNALRSFINGNPLQVNYYFFPHIRRYIAERYAGVDLAISTLIRTVPYTEGLGCVKLLDIVDSLALNYLRSAKNARSFLRKLLYSVEGRLLLRYERKCISSFDSTLFVNKYECDYWSAAGSTNWVPNGVNNQLFEYFGTDDRFNRSIVFLGKMDYQPNIDAILWFSEEVLPYLNDEITFVVIGFNPTKEVLALGEKFKNISVLGFVNDPYAIINSSFAVVAPMQTGGGIQNKILEAMALGKAVITTDLGASPVVGSKNGQHIFVENQGFEMAKLINDIYIGKINASVVGENARSLIKSSYTWEIYHQKLNEILEDVILREFGPSDSQSMSVTINT